jgi:hypothetical protein
VTEELLDQGLVVVIEYTLKDPHSFVSERLRDESVLDLRHVLSPVAVLILDVDLIARAEGVI